MMMNLINRASASIQARYVQPWMQNHFEKTQDGKRLAALKGKYAGQRCFLVGNGPSLKAEDLTKLHEYGEITFAFNRVYNIFDQTPWRPTFYISQDEKMLSGCADIVDKLELETKLIPVQLKWYYDIHIHDAIYFNMKTRWILISAMISPKKSFARARACIPRRSWQPIWALQRSISLASIITFI